MTLAGIGAVAGAAVLAGQPATIAHRVERPIVVAASGPQRLLPDVTLLAGAMPFDRVERPADPARPPRAHGGLSDLRLHAPDGAEVPYLLVYPPAVEPQWLTSALIPLAATEKTSGFEADLGAVEPVDAIRVSGLPPPFLKRLVLEGSGDRAHWTMLAAEGTLFSLPEEALSLDTVPFRPGAYRYLRVAWDDTNSGRMPLPGSVTARRAREEAPEPARLVSPVTIERRPSEPGISRYRIRLPGARLPIVALTLDVGGGHVFRHVLVTESRLTGREAAPAEIGRATVTRVVRDGVAATALRVPLTPPREPEINLVIEDGSNPPLDIRGATIELAELPWIYFEASAGTITARYGDRNARAPQYDLEAVRDSIRIGSIPEARWGAPPSASTREPPAAEAGTPPEPGAPLDPGSFRVSRTVSRAPPRLAVLPLDAAALAHSRRFDDVRLLDDRGRQVPYLLERSEEPLSLPLSVTPHEPKAREIRGDEGRRVSTYVARLPFPDLPSGRIVLETSARVFRRSVQIGFERPPDRHRRDAWFEPRAGVMWQHADQSAAAPPVALELGSTKDRELVIVVEEGDNSPLPITSARLLLPSYRLRFFHPGTPLRLVYGNDRLGPPEYDLALLATHVLGAEAHEIEPEAEAAPQGTERSPILPPAVFWTGLAVAVLVLLGLIVVLVRRA